MAQPQAPQKTQAEVEAEAAASYAQYELQLTTHYKIPDDLAAKLETEPEVVLPTLAARMHIAVVNEVMARVQRDMPAAFHQMQTYNTREEAAKNEFYGRWPELKGHETEVFKAGAIYRQLNPSASKEQALEGVGQMCKVALGMALAPAPGAIESPAPIVRTAPAAPAFRPASPGGSGGAPAPKETNPFTNMADDFLKEDQGLI